MLSLLSADAQLGEVAAEVEKTIVAIIDEAAGGRSAAARRALAERRYTSIADLELTARILRRPEAVGSSPEQFGAFLRSETEKWGAVLIAADIRPSQ